MGFNEVKKRVLECLKNGDYQHEERNNIDVKNKLRTGEISIDEAIKIISRAKGNNHSTSPHHAFKEVTVHIIKIKHLKHELYIKWYFLEPNSVFISFH